MKIALFDVKSIGEGLEFGPLEALGDVVYYDYTREEDFAKRLEGIDVAVSNKMIYTKEILESSQGLKLVCMTGTGYNNIDIDAAKDLGIGVCNVVGYSTISVAQHTLAMVLHLLNQLGYYKNYVGRGLYIEDDDFKHYEVSYRELSSLRWGIIGMGNIGRKVASLAAAFGAELVYYSTTGKNRQSDYKEVSLDEVITSSDILTIHAPLNDTTKDLIDKEAISRMKESVIIVNVGRGGIVNEKDIVDAVLAKKVGGLGIDVFSVEPMSGDSPYLKISDEVNVLLTPHVAWASLESRQRVIEEVALNIESFQKKAFRNRVES